MTNRVIKARQSVCKKDGHIINCADDEFWYCMYCLTKIDTDE
jgi:hypothetical protein